ncbi:MAG: hypothetical protein A2X40_11115 [Elusimicrobia bacterium GWC2_65_9]|nr:MAG: hypothetical protein A2X40_11115 [Elusimicrobia bacterium GWC2_65_9]
MTTNSRPVTDYFGTRLEPRALIDGLQSLGLARFSLVLTDEEMVLRLTEKRGDGLLTARATTWLRGRLSPLFACRIERLRAAQGRDLKESFEDRRRKPLLMIALAEIWDEKKERSRAEDRLRARLAGGAAVYFRSWRRAGGPQGVRPATILAASLEPRALAWLAGALSDDPVDSPLPDDILLDGLEWGVARRPTIATEPPAPGAPPILADAVRCNSCGLCVEICPAQSLVSNGKFSAGGAQRCLSCFDCVEACPQDALRPVYGASSATLRRVIDRRPGWLSRLCGAPGPSLPAPFPPSYLLPKPKDGGEARWVLGLSVTTMQEHSAALLDGGSVAGAVEEERLSRVRHHGWKSSTRPGATIASDPTLCLEEVLCRRSIAALLSPRRLSLDDMDVLAVNGIPARYRRAYSPLDSRKPIPALRAGRVVYLSHHLCHAASAWRLSGQKESWILSVDGRCDRETAAVFKAARGRIRQVRDILSLSDRSIGGVYETVTRLLGFGSHGQGSVMALASFGKPSLDFSRFLSFRALDDYRVHERGLTERFALWARRPGAPLARRHKDLAASLQAALEGFMSALLKDSGVARGEGLCLSGGVALNCRMNALIRRVLRPKAMFVSQAANDAGTALGAALEAAAVLGFPAAKLLGHSYLGPEFTQREAEAALKHAGLDYRRTGSVACETARLLAKGGVVCWCQGRMEFGPRALGARSILADPRQVEMHARVNRIKDRESWRPFGPSILAGREKDWFKGAFDSRFMLFALPFRSGRAKQVPAVAHVDGTSRPQSVHRDASPLYHALITEFHKLTGVPLLLNTSFNRRGEPIVCTPEDAVECFLGMPDADALVLGPFIARRPAAREASSAEECALAALPGGRRLMLRLSARCDTDCEHCTLRDLSHRRDRSFDDALKALAEGRRAACSELVVMRGEALLWPNLAGLLRRARMMGYAFIQLQTSGRVLARADARRELLPLVDAFEITLYCAHEATHDQLTRAPGSFRQTLMGVRAAVAAGREVALNVPVLRRNCRRLRLVAALAAKLGVRRVQFCFPRPVETRDGVEASALPRLSDASPHIREALRAAAQAGVPASTEAVPFCHLDSEQRTGPDADEDWRRFRVDDLDRLEESLDPQRPGARPQAPVCRDCRMRDSCPRTWALYLALFGSAELRPFLSAGTARPA